MADRDENRRDNDAGANPKLDEDLLETPRQQHAPDRPDPAGDKDSGELGGHAHALGLAHLGDVITYPRSSRTRFARAQAPARRA